jgi:hypothetical protein
MWETKLPIVNSSVKLLTRRSRLLKMVVNPLYRNREFRHQGHVIPLGPCLPSEEAP